VRQSAMRWGYEDEQDRGAEESGNQEGDKKLYPSPRRSTDLWGKRRVLLKRALIKSSMLSIPVLGEAKDKRGKSIDVARAHPEERKNRAVVSCGNTYRRGGKRQKACKAEKRTGRGFFLKKRFSWCTSRSRGERSTIANSAEKKGNNLLFPAPYPGNKRHACALFTESSRKWKGT